MKIYSRKWNELLCAAARFASEFLETYGTKPIFCSIDVYNSEISMKINPFYILAPPSFKLNGVIQKLWGNLMWVYK